MRLAACALAVSAFIAATPAPQPGSDLVSSFAATWTCRTVSGDVVHQTGRRDGDIIVVREDLEHDGKHEAFQDRYVFDRALNRWHVVTGREEFSGAASPWTSGSWVVYGQNPDGDQVRMSDDMLPGGDLRRSFSVPNGPSWIPHRAERCSPGPTPPAPDACIVENYPAGTLYAAPIKRELIPPNAPRGLVQVIISLDEQSHVMRARIQSSTAPELNNAALDAARSSRFQTMVKDCKPLAADFVFSVRYGT